MMDNDWILGQVFSIGLLLLGMLLIHRGEGRIIHKCPGPDCPRKYLRLPFRLGYVRLWWRRCFSWRVTAQDWDTLTKHRRREEAGL